MTQQNPLSLAHPWPCPKDPYAFVNALIIAEPDVVYERGAVVVQQDQILACLPQDAFEQQYAGLPTIDCRDFIITPGLVNAHTHAPMSFFRGLGWGQPASCQQTSMIESFLFPAEKSLTEALIKPLSYSYLVDALCSGVTTIADHYYFVAGVGHALEQLGMRGVIGETIADLGGAFPQPQRWDDWRQVMEHWPFSHRITPAIAPHAADTVSQALLQELAHYAQKQQLPLHLHLSQTHGERERVLKREGMTPVAFAEACGALSPSTLAVHLVTADEHDIKRLQASGATAVICPASQIIYEELAPITALWDRVPVAVATDCAASNDTADAQQEARWFSLLLRHHGTHCTPAQLLATITTTPAKALGLGDKIGKIAAGYHSDLLFYQKDLTHAPRSEPLNNYFYSMQSRHLQHVMIAGQWCLWQRTPTKANLAALEAEYQDALAALQARKAPAKKRES